MQNGEERRAARRFAMALPVKVRFSEGDAVSEKSGETRDVSYRGLYFTIDADPKADSPIEFVLTLPQQITMAGDVHIRCYGRVLRTEVCDNQDHGDRPSLRGVAARIERHEFLPPS